MRYKKNHYQWPNVNKPFLIVIYHSSLVKAATNAARGKSRTKTLGHLSIAGF
jgi:hypothetical protein